METLKDKIQELEREEILKALRECGWIMAKAARKLGISVRMIGYKINKYGIRIKEVRWIEHTGDREISGPGKQPNESMDYSEAEGGRDD
jgi:Nif-specific regulatory protein